MALERKYSTRTSFLNFPPGVSPADRKGVDFAQDALMNLLDADDVKVSFPVNDKNQPLLHKMQVEVFNHPKKGQFLNTAAIDGDVANALGDLIEDLANDGDAQGSLDALQQKIKGGDEDPLKDRGTEDSEGEEDKEDGEPSGAVEDESPFGGGLPKPGENPTPGKGLDKKTPFASRNSNRPSPVKRAVALEKEYGVPINEGVKIARRIDKTANAQEGLAYLRKEFLDEDGSPLDNKDYIRIAEITRGEKAPETPLV